MRIPIAKLKAILRYFGTYTDQKFLGKVKLMKLFYFLDFLHVKKYGCPVTYDRYVNLEHGPIPSTILNLVNEAINDVDSAQLADAVQFEKSDISDMCRMKVSRAFSHEDKDYFKESELETLDIVCRRFGDKNTKYIEDASHEEFPWRGTNFLDDIPYALAAGDKDCKVDKEEIEFFQQL